ncbi:MAG: leucine-rich repeat domain-containing protein [Bacteroidaceae bacterium]|nr:leucine-rich repeat domain-containing protein [Bacteroidaceae bacterium]
MKKSFFLFFLMLLAVSLMQGRTNIPLVKDVPHGGNDDKARAPAVEVVPIAYLEENSLIIEFPFNSSSEIIIKKRETEESIYSEESDSTYQIIISLAENHINAGDYELHLTFANSWWKGYFVIEEPNVNPSTSSFYAEINGFIYKLSEESKTAELSDVGNIDTHNIQIPAFVEYDSQKYDVTVIGECAFYRFYSTRSISIPTSVKHIKKKAFADCWDLDSIYIPNSVTSIDCGAFQECQKLSYVHIPEEIAKIDTFVFAGCDFVSIEIPQSVTSINDNAFAGCKNLSSVEIPSNVSYIGAGAFSSCLKLTSIQIPNRVSYIGEGAFKGCMKLTSVDLPENITVIENTLFWKCSSLVSICIPPHVTSIGDWAFLECDHLASIVIPSSVSSIGRRAFQYCRALKNVMCYAETPPSLFENSFSVYGKLNVPSNVKSIYGATRYWNEFSIYTSTDVPAFSPDNQDEKTTFFDFQGHPADINQKGILIKDGKKILTR